MVFVFFGLVAVVGTTYVQTETFEWPALYAAVGVGALACAILVVNNLRDIPTDTVAGKRTLAVRARATSGPGRSTLLLVLAAAAAVVAVAVDDDRGGRCSGWVPAGRGARRCGRCSAGATGPGLVPVLQQTGLAELLWAGCSSAAWRSVSLRLTRPDVRWRHGCS